MNTTFEKTENSTDEWYTPKEIIDSLGKFDTDPCAPINPLWRTADIMYNKNDDGLSKNWYGRVWLNPPYSRPLIEQFVDKMVEHGNGIMLLFNRFDNKLFQDVILQKASAMLLMRGRIEFYLPNGTKKGTPNIGSVLFAFGERNSDILRECDITGKFVLL